MAASCELKALSSQTLPSEASICASEIQGPRLLTVVWRQIDSLEVQASHLEGTPTSNSERCAHGRIVQAICMALDKIKMESGLLGVQIVHLL